MKFMPVAFTASAILSLLTALNPVFESIGKQDKNADYRKESIYGAKDLSSLHSQMELQKALRSI
jgi:hypothetical protein